METLCAFRSILLKIEPKTTLNKKTKKCPKKKIGKGDRALGASLHGNFPVLGMLLYPRGLLEAPCRDQTCWLSILRPVVIKWRPGANGYGRLPGQCTPLRSTDKRLPLPRPSGCSGATWACAGSCAPSLHCRSKVSGPACRPWSPAEQQLRVSVPSLPPAGHPDGVRNSDRVLGPRPGGPAHGPVRGGALQRTGAPGQALREELLRGEDSRRWLAEHYQIALLGQAGLRGKRLPLSPKNRGSRRLPLNPNQCFLEAQGVTALPVSRWG